MLLSKLTKFLHPKSLKTSPKEEKPSEVTCVQSEEILTLEEEKNQNSDFEIRNKAAAEDVTPSAEIPGTTSHLTGSVPRRVETPKGVMTKAEMREARELFQGLDDSEIHRLYKKVTQ
jgi:hypothetical protein